MLEVITRGIVGYVGGREACPILLKGLHRLEYRGYDSAGVAMVDEDGALNVYKCKGKVSDLENISSRGRSWAGRSASRNIRAGRRTASRTTSMPIRTAPSRRISP